MDASVGMFAWEDLIGDLRGHIVDEFLDEAARVCLSFTSKQNYRDAAYQPDDINYFKNLSYVVGSIGSTRYLTYFVGTLKWKTRIVGRAVVEAAIRFGHDEFLSNFKIRCFENNLLLESKFCAGSFSYPDFAFLVGESGNQKFLDRILSENISRLDLADILYGISFSGNKPLFIMILSRLEKDVKGKVRMRTILETSLNQALRGSKFESAQLVLEKLSAIMSDTIDSNGKRALYYLKDKKADVFDALLFLEKQGLELNDSHLFEMIIESGSVQSAAYLQEKHGLLSNYFVIKDFPQLKSSVSNLVLAGNYPMAKYLLSKRRDIFDKASLGYLFYLPLENYRPPTQINYNKTEDHKLLQFLRFIESLGYKTEVNYVMFSLLDAKHFGFLARNQSWVDLIHYLINQGFKIPIDVICPIVSKFGNFGLVRDVIFAYKSRDINQENVGQIILAATTRRNVRQVLGILSYLNAYHFSIPLVKNIFDRSVIRFQKGLVEFDFVMELLELLQSKGLSLSPSDFNDIAAICSLDQLNHLVEKGVRFDSSIWNILSSQYFRCDDIAYVDAKVSVFLAHGASLSEDTIRNFLDGAGNLIARVDGYSLGLPRRIVTVLTVLKRHGCAWGEVSLASFLYRYYLPGYAEVWKYLVDNGANISMNGLKKVSEFLTGKLGTEEVLKFIKPLIQKCIEEV